MEFKPSDFLILVVDDIPNNLKLVGVILDQVGYNVTFATSGQQALSRVETAQPDIILLDLMMPVMSGLDVCKILKANPKYQEIPIIFLTASMETEHITEAFAMGAVDYITKPFKSPELLARVKTHLELKYAKEESQKLVKDLRSALDRVKSLAISDPLTGILNRRHWFDLGQKEFNRSRKNKWVLSVFILDIDHFKSINDNYGHGVGDEVLKEFTIQLKESLGENDCFGRFGGEEFVIFSLGMNKQGAFEKAQKIAANVRKMVFNVEAPVTITVSIGFAISQPEDDNIEEIVKRADNALYQAKCEGGDRVVMADDKIV